MQGEENMKRKASEKIRAKIIKCIKEGRVEFGNAAYKSDKGKGSILCGVLEKGAKGIPIFWVSYSIPGFGFGEFVFGITDLRPEQRGSKVRCGKLKMLDSECTGREFVKKVLCRMVDEAEWDMPPKATPLPKGMRRK